MRKHDPLRLKQSRDVPPELVRALEALRKGADETARLERVGRKLGPLLDAPAGVSRVASGAHNKAAVLKLVIGALALLVQALWFALEPTEKPGVPTQLAQPAAPANIPPQASEPAALAPAEPTLAAPDTTDRPLAAVPNQPSHRGHGRATRSVKTHERQQPSAASAATDSPAVSSALAAPQLAPQQLAQSETAPSSESHKPHAPIATPPTAARPNADTAKPTAPAPASEAQLLFDARKAMPNDAPRALQLLDEHEKRFPHGQLVPEREVLAIEALRSLGRKAEADARLHRFEARYPNSFHLERLQH